ncbi:MAG: hypothetical protein QME60_01380 [Verrucomicrobiota bacterium]|nr:hypothetical protein [Verrucomicrobiota bacterium]
MLNAIDPNRIRPTEGRALVKRIPEAEMIGKIINPKLWRKPNHTFEAEVLAINPKLGDDAQDVHAGDRVHVSSYTNVDDSRFIKWDGDEYALIPTDAIQAVLA